MSRRARRPRGHAARVESASSISERAPVAALLGVLVLTIWIYWPVHGFGFVTWDDGVYVSQNPDVRAGLTWETIRWAFTTRAPYWHPLAWISHAFDVEWFGLNAGAGQIGCGGPVTDRDLYRQADGH